MSRAGEVAIEMYNKGLLKALEWELMEDRRNMKVIKNIIDKLYPEYLGKARELCERYELMPESLGLPET